MSNKLLSGSDLKCYINGAVAGEITGLRYSIDYGKKESYGIDCLVPFEIIGGPTKISGSLSMYRIRGTGGAEGRAMVAPFQQLSLEKYITIQVIDRVFQFEILRVDYGSITNQSWSVDSRGVMSGTLNFSGILASTEGTNP